MASQWSASVPLELPIACEYSHMISGWRWSPDVACSTMAAKGRIHRAGQVADRSLVARPVPADGALVVERPGRVERAHPGGRGLVVGAVTGLVAQRPGDDRWVVPVALDHPRHAGDPLAEVARVVAQGALEGVRLDVRLVDDVQAELVGQVEEGRVVRVVRRAHGVEPELLHLSTRSARIDVRRDDPSGVLVEVVAVDAADEDPPAVDRAGPGRGSRPAGSRPGPSPPRRPPRPGRPERDGGGRGARGALGGPRLDARRRRGRTRPTGDAAGSARRFLGPPGVGIGVVGHGRRSADDVPGHDVGERPGRGARWPRGRPRGRRRARPGSPPRPSSRPRARRRREADIDRQVERAGRQVVGEAGDRADVGEMDRPRRVQGRPSGVMPPCHHWSWSSTYVASDHFTTVRRRSLAPARTTSVTSNSAARCESLLIPTLDAVERRPAARSRRRRRGGRRAGRPGRRQARTSARRRPSGSGSGASGG